MEPDLIGPIYDALLLGDGNAGRLIQGAESFVLADNFIPPSYPEDGSVVPATLPTMLHIGSGRRFTLQVVELDPAQHNTPGDPTAVPEVQPVETPQSGVEAGVPSVAAQQPTPGLETPPVPPTQEARGYPDVLLPQPEPEEDAPLHGGRPSDAIQAPFHQPQPENPQSNVPPDFELKVAERDAQIQPGAPLPAPDA